ncbi:501_t:CDS:10 [Paraglomus occultum]|uniref:501_t:CDS:1 n=1 Tax=Paraglomus occultum TaxID=144539 RepID=A0A9N9BI39_9GLOM|nr:501_t:CDS:10 [Paraglomus occultum]
MHDIQGNSGSNADDNDSSSNSERTDTQTAVVNKIQVEADDDDNPFLGSRGPSRYRALSRAFEARMDMAHVSRGVRWPIPPDYYDEDEESYGRNPIRPRSILSDLRDVQSPQPEQGDEEAPEPIINSKDLESEKHSNNSEQLLDESNNPFLDDEDDDSSYDYENDEMLVAAQHARGLSAKQDMATLRLGVRIPIPSNYYDRVYDEDEEDGEAWDMSIQPRNLLHALFYVDDKDELVVDKRENTQRTDVTPLNRDIPYHLSDLFTPPQNLNASYSLPSYKTESTREVTKFVEGSAQADYASPTQPEDYDSEDADNFSDVSNINENEEPPSFHNELADGKAEDFVDVNEETISDEMSEYTLSTDNTRSEEENASPANLSTPGRAPSLDNTIRDQNEMVTPKTLDKDEMPPEMSVSLKHSITHEDSGGRRKRRRTDGAITDAGCFLSTSECKHITDYGKTCKSHDRTRTGKKEGN